MDDERLADLLEELPEDEQLRLIEGLDLDRLVGVLEEMEYDDLTDLLGEMPDQQREAVLEAMDDEDAEVLTRLLSYDERTAGGLMTPDVIILGPDDTVAEALAQLRDPNWSQAVASQVFICQGPFMPPTGRYLGVVYAQRLLREPPSMTLGRCLRNIPTTTPDAPEQEVHEQFAHYNLMALPVLDEAGRLLGAIAVDDVVDRLLGVDWRSRQRRRTTPVQPMVTP
jgi:Mg/Co/Ni transporter MgtE